jgi:trigger factor
MQTTVERQERGVVRLTVEVPATEFAPDLDRAYRKVARQVKIPGFRQGKAPRRVIDAMVGHDVVIEEFVHDAVPAYYVKAIDEQGLVPIAEPDVDVDDVDETEPLRFTVTVEVRPRVDLDAAAYTGLRLQSPSIEPTDAEVDGYVDRLRERFAELETVPRPVAKGDFVLADIRGHIHDQEVPEATRLGYLTEVGSEDLLPELDRELQGARAGDILKFNATLGEGAGERAGQEVAFQVLVKEVKAKRLPPADDDLAKTASEFDTLEELRGDIRSRLRELKETESRAVLRDRALDALVDAVDVELPERMVDRETDRHVANLRRRLERAGITMEQALESQGWDELRLRADSRAHATRDIKAELALEAIARQEGLEATPEELDREVAALARATKRDPKQVRRLLERSGEAASVAGDIIRSKALDLVVDRADVVQEDATAGDAVTVPAGEPEAEPEGAAGSGLPRSAGGSA